MSAAGMLDAAMGEAERRSITEDAHWWQGRSAVGPEVEWAVRATRKHRSTNTPEVVLADLDLIDAYRALRAVERESWDFIYSLAGRAAERLSVEARLNLAEQRVADLEAKRQ